MRLYLIRHGETDWNRLRRLQGDSDIPLNQNGLTLASVTGKGLADVPFDLCISSPLTRTRQTALCVLKENRRFLELRHGANNIGVDAFVPFERFIKETKEAFSSDPEKETDRGFPLLTDPHIIEANFGSWEGLGCGPDNMEIPDPSFQNFFTDPTQVAFPKDAETVSDVKRRTAEFLKQLCAEQAFRDKTILVTSHGFAIRAMLNPFYEKPDDFWQGHAPYNCAVNILETDADGKLHLITRDELFYDPGLAATYTDNEKNTDKPVNREFLKGKEA